MISDAELAMEVVVDERGLVGREAGAGRGTESMRSWEMSKVVFRKVSRPVGDWGTVMASMGERVWRASCRAAIPTIGTLW